MNAVKKDKEFSAIAFGKAVAAVMAESAETLELIKAQAEAAVAAKEAAKAGREASTEVTGSLWESCRELAKVVDRMTADLESQSLTNAVYTGLIEEVCTGEAAKSVAAYASTGRRLIETIRSGRIGWARAEELSYKEVRDEMKDDSARKVDDARKEVGKIVGRIAKHKSKAQALKMLNEVAELLESFAVEADASREEGKTAAKAAKELEGIRQQAPTEPTVTETVKAA